MARLIAFFLAVLAALWFLRALPIVGRVFQIPLVGFWLTAILVSGAVAKLGAVQLERRADRRKARELLTVETPHNLGEYGSHLATRGRFAAAIPYLERAIEGEPEVPGWRYRLGQSRLAVGEARAAAEQLRRCLEIDEEHAYGSVLLQLAAALSELGEPGEALEVLERFERNHGPNPESAYRRGVALAALGRKDQAHAAWAQVADVLDSLPAYQKKGSATWRWKAWLARLR